VLIEAGLIAGADMTPEAALSKLSYVLARDELDIQAKKKVGPPARPFACSCGTTCCRSAFKRKKIEGDANREETHEADPGPAGGIMSRTDFPNRF